MVDPGLRHAELLHRRGGRLPGPLLLLPFRQVQFAYQFRQALRLDGVLVVVIPLDDLLLVRRVIGHCPLLSGFPGGATPRRSHAHRLSYGSFIVRRPVAGPVSCVPSSSAFRTPGFWKTGPSSGRSAPACSSSSASPARTRPPRPPGWPTSWWPCVSSTTPTGK